jgi:hypothetical protein
MPIVIDLSLPPKESTVARPNPRLAAGVGVLSAFLLLAGLGEAVVLADPGGSQSNGSDRGNNSDRSGGGTGHDAHGNAGLGSGNRSTIRDGADDSSKGGNSPRVRVGSGREGAASLSPSDASTGTAQLRPGDASPGTARLSPSDSLPGFGGGASAGGSDQPGATPAFKPPRVVIGDGRSPGILSGGSEPRWQAPAPQLAEPPPPPAPAPAPLAPAPSWVAPTSTPPTVARQFVVAPKGRLTGPSWLIAGLLLIPAAAAPLGYRQARAAQIAERLSRR